MNNLKEISKKTEELKRIKESASSLKSEIRKLSEFLNAHSKQENENVKQSIFQYSDALHKKFSVCKDFLDALYTDYSDLRIKLDESNIFGGKKKSRKQQKEDETIEAFVVAYLDAEDAVKVASQMLTDVSVRVKSATDKSEPQITVSTVIPPEEADTKSKLDAAVVGQAPTSRLDNNNDVASVTPASRLNGSAHTRNTNSRLGSIKRT